jgi:glycogen operon protein
VIYEVHVKGFTKRLEGVRDDLRGTYGGLASAASIDYLKALGITAVELQPRHRSSTRFARAWADELLGL